MESNTLATVVAAIILLLLQEWRASRVERNTKSTATELAKQTKVVNEVVVKASAVVAEELKKNGGDSVKDKVDQAAADSVLAVKQNERILSRLDELEKQRDIQHSENHKWMSAHETTDRVSFEELKNLIENKVV